MLGQTDRLVIENPSVKISRINDSQHKNEVKNQQDQSKNLVITLYPEYSFEENNDTHRDLDVRVISIHPQL